VIESAIEGAIGGAIAAGGLSALGAALCVSVSQDSAIAYEEDVKTDRFLVMAHGSAEEVERGELS